MKNNKYHIIMLGCGYAESSKTSVLIYTTVDGRTFNTKIEAVKALALDLYNKYYDEHLKAYLKPSCCKTAIGKFCSNCGSILNQVADRSFDHESYKEWITSLHDTTYDDYGEAEFVNGTNLTFWPWRTEKIIGAKKNEIVFIPEYAECVLLEALYEQVPELMSEEEKTALANCLVEYDGLHMTDWQRMLKAGE